MSFLQVTNLQRAFHSNLDTHMDHTSIHKQCICLLQVMGTYVGMRGAGSPPPGVGRPAGGGGGAAPPGRDGSGGAGRPVPAGGGGAPRWPIEPATIITILKLHHHDELVSVA